VEEQARYLVQPTHSAARAAFTIYQLQCFIFEQSHSKLFAVAIVID
jgi:hypothetical protein